MFDGGEAAQDGCVTARNPKLPLWRLIWQHKAAPTRRAPIWSSGGLVQEYSTKHAASTLSFEATRNRVAVAAKVFRERSASIPSLSALSSSRKATRKPQSSQIHVCRVARSASTPLLRWILSIASVTVQRASRCRRGGSPNAFARSRLQPTRARLVWRHGVAVAQRVCCGPC